MEHQGMICGCKDCIKLKGGVSDMVKGSGGKIPEAVIAAQQKAKVKPNWN